MMKIKFYWLKLLIFSGMNESVFNICVTFNLHIRYYLYLCTQNYTT